MTLPAAPQTTEGEALLYLVDDNLGTNRANALRGIGSTALNGEDVAHLAVGSHLAQDPDGGTEPVVLVAGSDGSSVRALLIDNTGRVIPANLLVDNAAFADGTTRLGMAGFVYDEVAGTALTENDAVAARVDIKRAQAMVLEDETTRGRRATVDADKALVVRASKLGSVTNRSGSVTAGGTSQQLAGALATRRYLLVQNVSAEALWINFGTAAVGDQPSVKIPVDGMFVMDGGFVDTQAVNIIGATTGSKFTAKEG